MILVSHLPQAIASSTSGIIRTIPLLLPPILFPPPPPLLLLIPLLNDNLVMDDPIAVEVLEVATTNLGRIVRIIIYVSISGGHLFRRKNNEIRYI